MYKIILWQNKKPPSHALIARIKQLNGWAVARNAMNGTAFKSRSPALLHQFPAQK